MLNCKKIAGIIGVCGLSMLAGCLDQGVSPEKKNLALIHPGVTTRVEIEASFGPPDSVDTMDGHSVLVYSHIKAEGSVLCFLGGMEYDRQSYQFILNKNDQVESYVLKEYHGGTAIFTGVSKETPPQVLVPVQQ